jgi:hypothetical protein
MCQSCPLLHLQAVSSICHALIVAGPAHSPTLGGHKGAVDDGQRPVAKHYVSSGRPKSEGKGLGVVLQVVEAAVHESLGHRPGQIVSNPSGSVSEEMANWCRSACPPSCSSLHFGIALRFIS